MQLLLFRYRDANGPLTVFGCFCGARVCDERRYGHVSACVREFCFLCGECDCMACASASVCDCIRVRLRACVCERSVCERSVRVCVNACEYAACVLVWCVLAAWRDSY